MAFYVGNSPVPGEFPAPMASNAENVSIWWRHHVEHSLEWNGDFEDNFNRLCLSGGHLLEPSQSIIKTVVTISSVRFNATKLKIGNPFSFHLHWNGKVVLMTTLIFTGDVEGKLQRIQWMPRLSTGRPSRFSVWTVGHPVFKWVEVAWQGCEHTRPQLVVHAV